MAFVTRYYVDDSQGKRSLDEMERRWKRLSRRSQGELKDIESQAGRSARSVERSFEQTESKLFRTFQRIKGFIAAAFASAAVGGVIRKLIGVNAELETYQATLTTVLRSEEEAVRKLEWIARFAAQTPFQIPELVEATVQLEAYGINAERVMKTLGDTAAGMGKRLGDVVGALADAQTGEFERLKELGIRAINDAGKTYFLYVDRFGKEQRALIDRNNRAMITSTLAAIWNERYEDAMQRRSRTFLGIVSNLQDTLYQITKRAGAGLFDELKTDLDGLLGRLNSLGKNGELTTWGDRISDALVDVYETGKRVLRVLIEYGPAVLRIAAVFAAARASFFAWNVVVGVGRTLLVAWRGAALLAAAGQALLTGNTLRAAAAMRTFSMAVRTSPIGLLVSVLGAAAAGFLLMRDRTDEATQALRDQQRQVRDNIAALREMSGAALAAEESTLRARLALLDADKASAQDELDRVRGRLQDGTVEQYDPASRSVVRRDMATYDPTLHRQLSERALALQEEINEREEARLGLVRQIGVAEELRKNDLDAELAFLRDQEDQLIRNNTITDEQRSADLAALREQIRLKQAERDKRTGDDNSGGNGPGGDADTRREAQRVLELARAYGPYRDALEAIHRDEEEIERLRELRGKAQGAERQQLSVLIRERERDVAAARQQAEALRGVGRAIEGFQKMPVLGPEGGMKLLRRLGITELADETRRYEAALSRLRNELEAGSISQEQYAQRAKQVSDTFMAMVRRAYAANSGLLTGDWEAAFRAAFEAIKDGADAAEPAVEGVSDRLGDLAQSLRAVVNVSDVFGFLSDEAKGFVRGLADVLDGMQRLDEARKRIRDAEKAGNALSPGAAAAAQALPVIGIAAGIASAVGGLISAFDRRRDTEREEALRQAEEMKRLRESLADNARSIRASIREMTRAVTVGGGVTGVEKANAEAGFGTYNALLERLRELRQELADTSVFLPQVRKEILSQISQVLGQISEGAPDFLKDLIESGIIDDSFLERYNLLLEQGFDAGTALTKLFDEGLRDALESFFDNFGQAGQSVAAAIEQMRTFQRLFGVEGPEAMRTFIDFLLQNVPGLTDELRARLLEAYAIDTSTEEGRAKLQALVQSIFEEMGGDGYDFGSLTPDELRDILDTLFGFTSGSSSDGTATSATFNRQITEVTGNRIAQYLEAMYVVLERIHDLVAGALASSSAGGGFSPQSLAGGAASLLPRSVAGTGFEIDGATAQVGPISIVVNTAGEARRIAHQVAEEVEEALYDRLRQEQGTNAPRVAGPNRWRP